MRLVWNGTRPRRIHCFAQLGLIGRPVALVVVAAALLLTAMGAVPAWATDGGEPSGPTDPVEFEKFLDGFMANEMERLDIPGAAFVHISAFGTIVIVFALSLLIWPAGAFIRKRRTRPAPTEWARRALWLEIGVAVALVLGTLAFFVTVSSTEVAYGPTPTLYLATGFITIGSIAGLALIPAAVGSWTYRWFTIGGRISYSLLALTAPYLLW